MANVFQTRYVTTRHALRCAIGGSALTAVGLLLPFTSGCLSVVLFAIATIAGSPEDYQGFQMRSVSLTTMGALIGLLSYTIVVLLSASSRTAAFFVTLPFIAFFSAMRPAAHLMPLPPVATITLGLHLITQFETKCVLDHGARSCLPRTILRIFVDVAFAWLLSNSVNLFYPDRAADIGRRILSSQLCKIGTVVSSVASNIFSHRAHTVPPRQSSLEPAKKSHDSPSAPNSSSESPPRHSEPGLPKSSVVVSLPRSMERSSSHEHLCFLNNYINRHCIEETNEMVHAAYMSLTFLRDLPPIGSTRAGDYSTIAQARTFLAAAAYEPQLLPESNPRWRNFEAWSQVVDSIATLVNKVSCLESVVELFQSRNSVFDYDRYAQFVGHAYAPLWASHYAACAATCASLSEILVSKTCKNLRGETSANIRSEEDVKKWRARRAEMYFGFLLHCRLASRLEGAKGAFFLPQEVRNLETQNVKPLDLQYNMTIPPERQIKKTDPLKRTRETDERRALGFFAIESHALAEELGHLRLAMTRLAEKPNAKGWMKPLHFLFSAFPLLKNRVMEIFQWRLHNWEVQFAFTHGLMLTCILGIAMFVQMDSPFFGRTEMGWAFVSALLSAQLSVEPTILVCLWRVVGTIMGVGLGFAFGTILNQIPDPHCRLAHLWIIPFMFIVIFFSLAFTSKPYRYPAFLVIITTAIMLLCPRMSPDCMTIYNQACTNCYPDWKHAIARAINVSLGIVFAFVFHVLFWPRFANEVALHKLSRAFKNGPRVMRRLRLKFFSSGLGDEFDSSTGKHILSDDIHNARFHMSSRVGKRIERQYTDVFMNDAALIEMVKDSVEKHVLSAITTVKTEAGTFQKGPFRLRPLLRKLESDFIALTVTLSELARILSRRPIFSPSYGRVAFDELIQPMLRQYEIIHISLNNLVGVTSTIIERGQNQGLEDVREFAADLGQAVAHLARCRSELRLGIHDRAHRVFQLSELDVDVRQRLSSWSRASALNQETTEERKLEVVDDSATSMKSKQLHVDDIILFDAFTFVAEGCLSSFVRIALAVLEETEKTLSGSEEIAEDNVISGEKKKRA